MMIVYKFYPDFDAEDAIEDLAIQAEDEGIVFHSTVIHPEIVTIIVESDGSAELMEDIMGDLGVYERVQ
jgi:hypothetical protein